ncbi:MAG: DeoR/GlpR family DNA-binding transcription regulator [Schaalia hyovaginalis]|uniref:DeoR/GlpR family DNA-binding transcription regulator n=1 Tax=Schaalia hyovaginalis TaxID=29316 RepID=UPI00139E5548|nr:DeoR/GlpR family DNA-binding transcription regulator [Schaalia hyovaginalis]MCF2711716.1 DeoR/GlpR transcriptional regulator [Schaalia hyovaginalis]MCI6556912.1 DeoR/GlpR family DNA-binding transcription regulator [Schaalia hyovaginalis]MCI7512750.1 DeoR/GlpR family DNA-binding transcription regulator [Schaalia hyovaginalis]MDD7554896.1 DeoR/GlpR family DNA-binding transcription regulator [Schaalia hyovaginalis]MDY3093263.1 DeoR/GlpR family DNA-binding transcription regulator [Schaalia hyov
MGRAERTSFILDTLARDGEVSVSTLAEALDVSPVTIRTTLKELEDEGYLVRTHGGARPTAYRNIRLRQNDRIAEKERIARAAAEMVRDDDRIMIEAGTTCSLLVKYLTARRGIQIVTNSLLVFANARPNPNIDVTLTGGRFHAETESLIGPVTERALNAFNARLVFLGTDGFGVDRGLTTQLAEGGHVGTLMRARAEETWCLADSSKYGRAGFVSFMGIEDVTGIITDDGLPEESIKELTERTRVRLV